MTFRFKAFDVVQSQSAMKIGTDAVLLGAWAPFSRGERILDIGSGTGVLALMMAQRFPDAQITAIDMDEAAANESRQNFEQSPWSNRLLSMHCSLEEFCQQANQEFDAIICNPPFYSDGYAPNSSPRSKARDTTHLRLEHLFSAANQLLSSQGEFALIYPLSQKENIVRTAAEHQLFPKKIMRVRGRPHLAYKRMYVVFDRHSSMTTHKQSLTLERDQHLRTAEYQKLVAPFYL